MLVSDWSQDVCSSDLATTSWPRPIGFAVPSLGRGQLVVAGALIAILGQAGDLVASAIKRRTGIKDFGRLVQIGRASCRERVWISGSGLALTKRKAESS